MSEHLTPATPPPPPPNLPPAPEQPPAADEPEDDESFERPPLRPVGATVAALLVQVLLAAISILLGVYVWVVGQQGRLAEIRWFILGFIGLLFLRQLLAIRRLLRRLGRPEEEESADG